MIHCKGLAWLSLLTATALLTSCASNRPRAGAELQIGESIVLADEEGANLAFAPLLSKPFMLRSTYQDGLPQTVHYEAGRDFVVEVSGQIRRTGQSRIPDFRTNILYGKEDFRHDQFPGFGNGTFFVYADYVHDEKWGTPLAKAKLGAARLRKTQAKLLAGEKIRMVAFGDSITAGGDASEPKFIFWQRWADSLRLKYPRATIEAVNGATGGDTTAQGLQRLQAKVIQQKPDVVFIGFGMNDHNREGFGVPLNTFADNLRTMIERIRSSTDAEIVLFSAFPPNPKWHYGSQRMEAYAGITEEVARERHCAFADVYHYWMSIAERKKPEDLLANNINHPNDFGHWIYFQAFEAIGL